MYSWYCSAMFCISPPKQPLGWGSPCHRLHMKFFKVLLLSSDYRPSVDPPSTKRGPITDRYIGEVSTNYRRGVREKSAKCRWSIGERKFISAEIHMERLSTVSRPSVVWLSPSLDRLSTKCRPRIDRVSTDYRPLYRPIDIGRHYLR